MIGRGFLVQVVEDDMVISRFIFKLLRRIGLQVVGASDGQSAVKQFGVEHPDLVILDLGIPEMDGLEVCRQLRSSSEVPIFMVTAKGDEIDMVRGLECGADDYLSKPFSESVLVARVKALLRRSRPWVDAAKGRSIELDDLVVDFRAKRVTRGDKTTHLTPTECRLLALLVEYRGKVLTSGRILSEVWGRRYSEDYPVLRTHIGRLRKKIETDCPVPSLILTAPGVGYTLAAGAPQESSTLPVPWVPV